MSNLIQKKVLFSFKIIHLVVLLLLGLILSFCTGQLHALVQQPFNLLEVISGLHADKPQLTPLQQLQVAAFERMKCDPVSCPFLFSSICQLGHMMNI